LWRVIVREKTTIDIDRVINIAKRFPEWFIPNAINAIYKG